MVEKSIDIDTMAQNAGAFRKRLDRLKRSAGAEVEWYPYNSFGVFNVLDQMLRGEYRRLTDLAEGAPVLDLGAGDGDFSFFLESLGMRALAIDSAGPNFNRTRGLQWIRSRLDSSIQFVDWDLDQGLPFTGRTFGLAFCLGLLYHLKNPFGFLEALSRHVRYCVLNTRVARRTPHGMTIESEPLAYLVGCSETNGDNSNFWIFSNTGLSQLFERTGWKVCASMSTGDVVGSNPRDNSHDERFHCLLRSVQLDPYAGVDLEDGWHQMEHRSWRWTKRVFEVVLRTKSARMATLKFDFRVPGLSMNDSISLHVSINCVALGTEDFQGPGPHTYSCSVEGLITGEGMTIRFELEEGRLARNRDARELGVQVVFWSLDESPPKPLNPIRVIYD